MGGRGLIKLGVRQIETHFGRTEKCSPSRTVFLAVLGTTIPRDSCSPAIACGDHTD